MSQSRKPTSVDDATRSVITRSQAINLNSISLFKACEVTRDFRALVNTLLDDEDEVEYEVNDDGDVESLFHSSAATLSSFADSGSERSYGTSLTTPDVTPNASPVVRAISPHYLASVADTHLPVFGRSLTRLTKRSIDAQGVLESFGSHHSNRTSRPHVKPRLLSSVRSPFHRLWPTTPLPLQATRTSLAMLLSARQRPHPQSELGPLASPRDAGSLVWSELHHPHNPPLPFPAARLNMLTL